MDKCYEMHVIMKDGDEIIYRNIEEKPDGEEALSRSRFAFGEEWVKGVIIIRQDDTQLTDVINQYLKAPIAHCRLDWEDLIADLSRTGHPVSVTVK